MEGKKVLLARDQGAYYAVSSKCTHFGASLAKGKPSQVDCVNCWEVYIQILVFIPK